MKIIGTTNSLNANVSMYESLDLQVFNNYVCTKLDKSTSLNTSVDLWDLNFLSDIEIITSYGEPVLNDQTNVSSVGKINLIVLVFQDGEKLAVEVEYYETWILKSIESIRKLNTEGRSYLKSCLNNDMKKFILYERRSSLSVKIILGFFVFELCLLVGSFLFVSFSYLYSLLICVLSFIGIFFGFHISNKITFEDLIKSDENLDFLNNGNKK